MSFDWSKYRNPDQQTQSTSQGAQPFDWAKYRGPQHNFLESIKKQNPTAQEREEKAAEFDVEGALAEGYSPEEVERYLQTEKMSGALSGASALLQGAGKGLVNTFGILSGRSPEEVQKANEMLEKNLPHKARSHEKFLQRAAGIAPVAVTTGGLSALPGVFAPAVAGQLAEEGGAGPGGQLAAEIFTGVAPKILAKGLQGIGTTPLNAGGSSSGPRIKDLGSFKTSQSATPSHNKTRVNPTPIRPKAPSPATSEPIDTFARKEALVKELHPTELTLPELNHRQTQVVESVSSEAPRTSASEGREYSQVAQRLLKDEKAKVTAKYNKAREVVGDKQGQFSELAEDLQERKKNLELVEKRNPDQEKVYQEILAYQRIVGQPGELKKVPYKKLIAQSDSTSGGINYDIVNPKQRGQLRSIVHASNQAVITDLRRSGIDPFALQDADASYGKMADTFYNDELRDFLAKKNLNPEALFDKAVRDPGTYRALKNAIGLKNKGAIERLDRAIAEDRLRSYFKSPENIGSREFQKDIDNLQELIGETKVKKLERELEAYKKSHLIEREELKKAYKTVEDLDRAFKDRTSIRKLRKYLKEKNKESRFEELKKEKLEEIFKQELFSKKRATGNELKAILQDQKEVLLELLGEDAYTALYKEAVKTGKREVIRDVIYKLLKLAVPSPVKKVIRAGSAASDLLKS